MSIEYHRGRFPPGGLDWPVLIPLLGPASAAVARYEGVLQAVPNPDVLLAPLTTQEAVLSSRIEGTQATFDEVLTYEAQGGPTVESSEKAADIREVLNYRAALRQAVQMMKSLPLSQRIVREAHAVLMQGVRGQSRAPGEYRRVANWIGPAGSSRATARFIPPSPETVPELMSGWERYLHDDAPDRLVQLALLHAEFEAIHPFLDGNGRLGRLLVPLFLVEKGLLSSPNFYISAFLEAHRTEYYDRLLAVSRDDDWAGWCAFFLRAVIRQAEANEARARGILELYRSRKEWITAEIRSLYGVRALDWFFAHPIFRTSDFVASSGIPKPTANRLLLAARRGGLLDEFLPGGGRRAAILSFPELLVITEGRPALSS
ncbi:MAG: Fic family protein [Longimicrobiaceae bacterium]